MSHSPPIHKDPLEQKLEPKLNKGFHPHDFCTVVSGVRCTKCTRINILQITVWFWVIILKTLIQLFILSAEDFASRCGFWNEAALMPKEKALALVDIYFYLLFLSNILGCRFLMIAEGLVFFCSWERQCKLYPIHPIQSSFVLNRLEDIFLGLRSLL